MYFQAVLFLILLTGRLNYTAKHFWVARMAQGFGMKVIASSHHIKTGPEYASIEQVSTEEIYARADVISLNCSANPSTVNIINKESIDKTLQGILELITKAKQGPNRS